MNQKTINDSVRFSPLALAITLFVVLGLLALQARAQELESTSGVGEAEEPQTRNLFERSSMERPPQASQMGQVREDEEEKGKLLLQERNAQIEMMQREQEERRVMFEEKKEEIQERMEARKEERLIQQEERKERLQAEVQARLSTHAERIVTRMTAMLERMQAVADRVASRIQKMEDAGMDVEMVKVEHGEVYVQLEKSHEYVALISEVTIDTLTSENPAEQKGEIRESVTLAKESIREIHTALMETVREMQRAISPRETEEGFTPETEEEEDEQAEDN